MDKQLTCVHSEQWSHSNDREVPLTTNLQTGQKNALPLGFPLEPDGDDEQMEDEEGVDFTPESAREELDVGG